MIVLHKGVAFAVTCDDLLAYLDRASDGHDESLDHYGYEVGEYGGDVSALSPSDCALLARTIRARLAGGVAASAQVEDAESFADRVLLACEEDRMLELATQSRQVA